jgi:hypothetical protein
VLYLAQTLRCVAIKKLIKEWRAQYEIS